MKTTMEILYYLNSGKLDHGSARLAGWQHGLDKYRKNMDLQLYRPMCFNICVLLAFNGQWSQALAWLHRTLDGGQTDIRRDIRAWKCFTARILRSLDVSLPRQTRATWKSRTNCAPFSQESVTGDFSAGITAVFCAITPSITTHPSS